MSSFCNKKKTNYIVYVIMLMYICATSGSFSSSNTLVNLPELLHMCRIVFVVSCWQFWCFLIVQHLMVSEGHVVLFLFSLHLPPNQMVSIQQQSEVVSMSSILLPGLNFL